MTEAIHDICPECGTFARLRDGICGACQRRREKAIEAMGGKDWAWLDDDEPSEDGKDEETMPLENWTGPSITYPVVRVQEIVDPLAHVEDRNAGWGDHAEMEYVMRITSASVECICKLGDKGDVGMRAYSAVIDYEDGWFNEHRIHPEDVPRIEAFAAANGGTWSAEEPTNAR